jgi:two-component system sensor histidine kinase PhoQ
MSLQAPKSNYSIQNRLLISLSVLLFVFLGLTGIVLDRAFSNSIEAGASEQLQVQVYLLLAAAEEDAGEFYFLEDLQEPRFSQLNSGLYGFISKASLGELWRSDSALAFEFADEGLLRQPVTVGETQFSITEDDQQQEFFVLSYGILWEDGISEYSFTVFENAAPYYSEIGNFRTSLWAWLGGVAILLLMIQVYLMRWGLSPLHYMAKDLKEIESGKKNQLEGGYPRELQRVTDNLNLLIESERRQQERYRTTLGDLAHSLKTPLAVISGVLEKISSNRKNQAENEGDSAELDSIDEQLERMNQIVSYQLQRAVKADNKSSLSRQIGISRLFEKVLDALAKVYRDKPIQLETELDKSAIFNGDERDLMEMLGNVLDNAFKYGNGRVRVEVASHVMAEGGELVSIVVEDDGPGIDADKQEFVLQRGARADSLTQGQGIGLAVVTDIVDSYNGKISVGASKLGGARISISFGALR